MRRRSVEPAEVEPDGTLRFGAPRNWRLAVAVIGMFALLSAAIGTTISFGRNRPVTGATPRLVTTPEAAVSDSASPSPSVSPSGYQLPPALTALAKRTPKAAPRPAVPCATPPTLPSGDTIALTAIYRELEVFDGPNGNLVRRLPNPTRDNQPLHLRAVESAPGWYRAQMAERPNGTTGWVRAEDVTTSRTPYRILVERCARRLTLFQNGRPVMIEPVAVGTGGTPTPLGDFYVDFLEEWPQSSKYGPWLISVSGFSNVLKSFGGGVGQIGIHGTRARSSVGKAASHGCVRMHNEAIDKMARWVTAGTPVFIAP